MRLLTLAFLILASLSLQGQCVSFKLTLKGDTINCVDKTGAKQGRWKITAPPLRGERGYEEEGVFINGRKEGTWRRFSMMGDILAVENYKWGLLNGTNRYYTIAGLEREEGWRAINPTKQYDTIDVQDPNDPSKVETVIVKADGNAKRQGKWRYFNPMTGQLLKTENWFMDQIVEPGNEPGMNKNSNTTIKDSLSIRKDTATTKTKPKEVLEFEKKNSGKKKTKVRDGRTGG